MFDLEKHLARQMVFSRATFGPGSRQAGVLDHLTKEIEEVRNATSNEQVVGEWVDLVIISLDGLTRALWSYQGGSADEAAEDACLAVLHKQQKNERRDWPDWRSAPDGVAIEHVRGTQN